MEVILNDDEDRLTKKNVTYSRRKQVFIDL